MLSENQTSLRQTISVLIHRASELGCLSDSLINRCDAIEEDLLRKDMSEATRRRALLLISDLSKLIKPDTPSTLRRRRSRFYKSVLTVYNALLTVGVLTVVYTIIKLSILLAPVEHIVSRIDKLQSEASTSLLSQMETWKDVLFNCFLESLPNSERDRYSRREQDSGNSCVPEAKQKEIYIAYEQNRGRLSNLTYELISVSQSYRSLATMLNSKQWLMDLINVTFGGSVLISSTDTDINLTAVEPNTVAGSLKLFREAAPRMAAIRTKVEQIGIVVGAFLLPLMYGFLGALVYLMRDIISGPIGTISPIEHGLESFLRLCLGGVAGLSIGWFSKADEITRLAITPFAVAFVAGFSIDILFSLLERFVDLFSSAKIGGRVGDERRE